MISRSSQLFLIFFLCWSFNAFSQLSKGSPAPDFTVDIISKVSPTSPPTGSFSLSNETGQGKGVCLTFSATWCGPCWIFHNNGVMETIYNQYGPNGTNEVAVLFLEADQRTNRNCMFGQGGCNFGTSQGNWMNVPFDMTDLAPNNGGGVASDYAINYFPTLYVISPDMRAYEIRQRTLAEYESYLLHSFKLNATGQIQDATCGGDGSVSLAVMGGFGALRYNWSNGARTRDLSNVSAGSYSVTITDANGYDKAFGPFQVNGPSTALSVQTLRKDDLRCNGIPEGVISVAGGGGTPGYQYEWSNGPFGPEISGLSAGIYTVTVTDQNNCTTEQRYVVSEPPPLLLNLLGLPENCDRKDGEIQAYGDGGTPPHRYSMGGPFTGENIFRNLAAGLYTVDISDNNGCILSEGIEVEYLPGPVAIAGDNNLLGCGIDSLFLSGDGSEVGQGIVYHWTTRGGNILRGENSLTPEVDRPGIYILEVNDLARRCVSFDSVQVSNDTSVVSRAGNDTLINCSRPSLVLDGSETTQGPDMIYEWITKDGNIVAGGNSLTPLIDAPGTYALVARDTITMCFDTSRLLVGANLENPLLQIVPADTLTCEQLVVTIDATGSATGPEYIYSWTTSNGRIVSGVNTLTPEVDQPGRYELTILNVSNGCESYGVVQVIEQLNLPLAAYGFNIDTLSVQFSDRSQGNPLSWNWDFGDGQSSTDKNPNHLYANPGTYQVCLTIENECDTDVQCQELRLGFGLILSSYVLSNTSCFNGTDGRIDVTIQGGVPPYTFLWSTGSTDEDLYDIPAGEYHLSVTDDLGTVIEFSFEVEEPAEILLEDVTIQDATVNGSDGSIRLELKGGVAPFEYLWSHGGQGQEITGLDPGEYTCQVMDGNGCEKQFGPFVVGVLSSSGTIKTLKDFLLYPNPASDELHIAFDFTAQTELQIRILDISGSQVLHQNWKGMKEVVTLPLADFHSGIYIVQLIGSDGVATRKFSIKN